MPLRRNCEVGKNWGRSGSHCETRDEFACREEVWQGLVPLGMNYSEETGPTVPLVKNLNIFHEIIIALSWVSLCHLAFVKRVSLYHWHH